MPNIDAVVIASGSIVSSLPNECAGLTSLIPLGGKPAVQWVVEALRASESIRSIVLTGPQALCEAGIHSSVDQFLPGQTSETAGLLGALDSLSGSERVLVLAGNMALISPDAIDDFANGCPDGDVVYATVTREAIKSQFPSLDYWSFLKAVEGEITGTSALLFRPKVFVQKQDSLKRLFAARNDSAELMKICGMGIALKYALGQLSLSDVERQISQTLLIDGRSYISRYAGLAFEVKDTSVTELCERKLAERDE